MEGENINYWKDTTIRRAQEIGNNGFLRGLPSWNEFVKNFQESFAPIDEVDDSLVNLTNIRLKDYTSVDEFNARFMDLALKGNILDPTAQLALYRQALPDYLLRKIATSYPPPSTIAEWMTRTKEMDHSYQLTEKILSNRKSTRKTTTRKDKKIRAEEVEEENLEVDVKRLSDKERKDLQDKGLCFRCKKSGHISRNCPLRSGKKGQQRTKKIRRLKEEESDDESDKESAVSDDSFEVKAIRTTDLDQDF